MVSVTRRKSPNVYKSCSKIISLEKWKILTPSQNLPRNVGDLGKLIAAKGLKKLPKVQKIAKSGHIGHGELFKEKIVQRFIKLKTHSKYRCHCRYVPISSLYDFIEWFYFGLFKSWNLFFLGNLFCAPKSCLVFCSRSIRHCRKLAMPFFAQKLLEGDFRWLWQRFKCQKVFVQSRLA